jgi:CRP-like cAMP-binding protein
MNDLITKVDFFSGLDDKILKKISDACIVRRFTRNETIVRQGEMGLALYMIARGRVSVDREEKGVRMQVAELGPGQFFGETSLLDNKPRSTTVTGIEEAECLLLTRDSFVTLMSKYPEIPIRMTRVLAERLREANQRAAAVASAPPAVAPAPINNGAASAPLAPAGAKRHIQAILLDRFQSLYTLKALSRFSVAVLGCPVEGIAANIVDEIRVGDVKALFFPAGEPVEMRIEAAELGWFTLDVFTPSQPSPFHFGPLAADPRDPVRMTLLRDRIVLSRGEVFWHDRDRGRQL